MKDMDDDRSAILSVIEDETNAYIRRDYDAWDKCWCEGPEIRRIHSHVQTGVMVVEGDQIRSQMRRYMTGPISQTVKKAVERTNLNVVINGNMAWVTYDQSSEYLCSPIDMTGQFHELKILHKVDGLWKIACIVGTERGFDEAQAPLIEVDAAGRILWMNDLADLRLGPHPLLNIRGDRLMCAVRDKQADLIDALELLADVRDRHQTCITEGAVSRALALGSDDFGRVHICWLILRDERLLITFDDAERLDNQLEAAAEVYGLSKAQQRLARELVEGQDMNAAARALGITANTARTHLQRIYDKTGVRAQSALVRILLNADRQWL